MSYLLELYNFHNLVITEPFNTARLIWFCGEWSNKKKNLLFEVFQLHWFFTFFYAGKINWRAAELRDLTSTRSLRSPSISLTLSPSARSLLHSPILLFLSLPLSLGGFTSTSIILYSNSRPFSTPGIITPIILMMKPRHEKPFYVLYSLYLQQLKRPLLHQVSKLFLILLFMLIFWIAACFKLL